MSVIGLVWLSCLLNICFFDIEYIVLWLHALGIVDEFMLKLKIWTSIVIAMLDKCFSISLDMPRGPVALLFREVLIVSFTSSTEIGRFSSWYYLVSIVLIGL